MQIFKNWGKIGKRVIKFLSQTNSILFLSHKSLCKIFIKIKSKLQL